MSGTVSSTGGAPVTPRASTKPLNPSANPSDPSPTDGSSGGGGAAAPGDTATKAKGKASAMKLHGVAARVEWQTERIQQGLKNGWITDAQAKTLQNKVDELDKELKADEKGGKKLTKEERDKLNKEFDENSGNIYEQKQTGHMNKLVSEGKLTQAQANDINTDIKNWAGSVRANGKELGNVIKQEYDLFQADEKANKASATTNSTTTPSSTTPSPSSTPATTTPPTSTTTTPTTPSSTPSTTPSTTTDASTPTTTPTTVTPTAV